MKRKPWFLAVPLIVFTILYGGSVAVAQIIEPAPDAEIVDFKKEFPSPRVVGPPPPMADIWAFDSIAINPVDGSISAVLVVSLRQPDVDGVPQEPVRTATFTVAATAEEMQAIYGKDGYLTMMTSLANALHQVAIARGQEPAA